MKRSILGRWVMLSLGISGLERIWRMDCAGENCTNG